MSPSVRASYRNSVLRGCNTPPVISLPRRLTGVGIVTEVMDPRLVAQVGEYADMLRDVLEKRRRNRPSYRSMSALGFRGVLRVRRKSRSWSFSTSERPSKRSRASCASPPCQRIASVRVAARPSCR